MMDTNICINAIKHKPKNVFRTFRTMSPEDVCVSAVPYAELIYGVKKASLSKKQAGPHIAFGQHRNYEF